MQSAEEKYREAIELYGSSELTLTEISRRCGVTRTGLAAYIRRRHRDLMFQRHGEDTDMDGRHRLRNPTGQSAATHRKYRDAILACDDSRYVDMSVSEIAREYGLNPSGLGNQLRMHYPDILRRREEERQRRGLARNIHPGPRGKSVEMYAEAVELLQTRDISIRDAARACSVSFTGLRQHVQFYHKDLTASRRGRREKGREVPKLSIFR